MLKLHMQKARNFLPFYSQYSKINKKRMCQTNPSPMAQRREKMSNQFSRTELLIGKEGIEKLNKATVAVFGIGGVGSFVVEGLVRAGIENFILVDNDTISLTIGRYKVEVMEERILEINPNAKVKSYKTFYMPNCKEQILNTDISYVVDCMDTVTAKIELIQNCKKMNIPIISSMGTGNKLDPTKFEITDIYKTSVCPLAKVMRKELKARGIENLKVLYSKEQTITPSKNNTVVEEETNRYNENDNSELSNNSKKQIPGSISFVPTAAGLIIAGEVIKDIIGYNKMQ